MKELRVALFTGNYNHIKDGVSLTLNRLVGYLEQEGIPVKVFGPTIDEPEIEHKGTLIEVPSIRMPVSNRGEYRVTTGLPSDVQEELESFEPTLLHIATPDAAGYKALKWGMKKGIQIVASYHTHFTSYLKYYNLHMIEFFAWRYLNWFYSKCTHVYVPSQSMIDELAEHGIDNGMKVWARGVETELFSPEKRSQEWRRSLGFEEDDLVITFVSRLVWEKELATYMKSVQKVAQKHKRVKAMVVGEGPAKAELMEMMPEAQYTGFLEGEDLARAYASSDIFFFPSHTETFGNVTLEAMSSGLPCLVADAIGSKSLVKDGVNGRLAEVQNTTDFSRKLEEMVVQDKVREQMAKESRRLALEYEWDTINGGLVNYYKEALNVPAPQPDY